LMGVNRKDAKNVTKSHVELVAGIGKGCHGWWCHDTITWMQGQNVRYSQALANVRVYWIEYHCRGGRCNKSHLCPCPFFRHWSPPTLCPFSQDNNYELESDFLCKLDRYERN
jgi:hypothetical protein